MRLVAAITCLSILLAPMPWGIALNHETKECGGFWGGDEYGGYRLPEGWVDYYPRLGVIETEVGVCSFPDTTGYEAPGEGRAAVAEACCQELGYAYVGSPIGKAVFTPLMWGPALTVAVAACLGCLVVLLILLLVLGGVVLLVRGRRQKHQEENSTT